MALHSKAPNAHVRLEGQPSLGCPLITLQGERGCHLFQFMGRGWTSMAFNGGGLPSESI